VYLKIKVMKFKKKIKVKFLICLRKMGMLCKPPKKNKLKIHLSKSVYPDGSITEYDSPLDYVPLNKNSFESELHVYHEMKKDAAIKYNKNNKKIGNERSSLHK
jgi:hypothetical protein